MQTQRIQTQVSGAVGAAISEAAKEAGVSVADYLRRVIDLHLEGLALMEPVRVAVAEASTLTTQHALSAFRMSTEQQVAEARAEREDTHRLIADFVELLASSFNTKPAAPARVVAPDRPYK